MEDFHTILIYFCIIIQLYLNLNQTKIRALKTITYFNDQRYLGMVLLLVTLPHEIKDND